MIVISKLIETLQAAKEKYGNLEVFIHCDESDGEIANVEKVNESTTPYCCGDSIINSKYFPKTKGKDFIIITD